MTFEEYYGEDLARLKYVEQSILELLNQYPVEETLDGVQPIMYKKSRIKKPESMIRKLEKHSMPTDSKTALSNMHDTVGIRIICSFIDEVYNISKWLHARNDLEILEEKDYISYPKPNGYRSLHLIVKFKDKKNEDILAEIQIRTIALDFWAALEHQMKYKRHIEHEKIISNELKRCADEIASVDMSMQTIRDVLKSDNWEF